MKGEEYTPPYSLSDKTISLMAKICELIGQISVQNAYSAVKLRRINKIRTIQGSLAIEGNTLTEEQITAVLDGKVVIAPPREVQEVRNALKVYDKMLEWDFIQPEHLLKAHEMLMSGLLDRVGAYRVNSVGIMGKNGLSHIAPPADRVPFLIKSLFKWLEETEAHPLIKSAVFHYEFEFIHPFEDGNGRMGRLWQTMILSEWNPLFANIPVESLIHAHQSDYYKAINLSNAQASSTIFIEFMMEVILETLTTTQETTQETTRENMPERILDYLRQHPQATRQTLASALGNITADGVKYHLKKLRDAGRLRRIGSTKSGYWDVDNKG